MSIETWTRAVVRHRLLVLGAWVIAAIAGFSAATRLPSLLVNSLAVPGSASQHAEAILGRGFGERTEGTFVVVFRERDQSAHTVAVLQRRLDAAARSIPYAHATKLSEAPDVVYGDVATPMDLQEAKGWTPALRAALAAPRGPPALVTGEPALQYDLDPILAADLRRGDVIALVAALLVLTLAFGLSAAVLVPFLFAAATISVTLGLLYLFAHVFTISSYAPNLAQLIGLGLAIDYSLLIIHRFREELAAGRDVDDAVVWTMRTAGRAVVISGSAVALGLMIVLATPVPFVRSLGLAGFLVPLVSVAAALTLQPALLSLLGHRVRSRRMRRDPGRGWARFATAVTRRPRLLLAVTAALLITAAIPVAALALTPGSIAAIPQTNDSARGLALLSSGAGPGAVTPVEIIADTGTPGGASQRNVRAAVERLVNVVSDDPEAYVTAYGTNAPYVNASRRYVRVFVVGRHEFGDSAMQALVRRIRADAVPAAHFPATVHVYVGGASAQGVDYLDAVYGPSLWFAAAVLALAFLILLRAFGSLPLAASAIALNLMSVLATLGLLVVIFRDGVGADALGLYRLPQIEGWIPIFLVAMLFGLSMDYEVFLVLRMREAFDRDGDTTAAVAEGLRRTGPVITAAAAIMVAAFGGFVAGRVAGLQEFGAGLAVAVLLDATIIRLLLVPSLVLVLGRRAWWLPGIPPLMRGSGGG